MATKKTTNNPTDIVDWIDGGSEVSLTTILLGILETILELPWLDTHAGGVFLADAESGHLSLAAQRGFSPQLLTSCARVPYGHCLCGRVAQSEEMLHVCCVDERHDIRYSGMPEHGHYVVPIKSQEQLLGVIVLYVKHGHTFDGHEAEVLENFANLMALQIHTAQFRQDKRLADLILANSAHSLIITNHDKQIQWVNHAFEKVTGYSREEVIGKTPAILRSGRHGGDFYRAMWRDIEEHGLWEGEIWNRRKNGEIYPEWLNIVALKDRYGRILRYAAMFIDLTPVKRAEEKAHRLAYYDTVTGLPNAVLLHERLQALLEDSRQTGANLLLFTLDLDHFKEINASLGRRVGDAILREVARRITGLEKETFAARMGADEFVIVCPCEENDVQKLSTRAGAVASRLHQRLEEFHEFEGQELSLRGTIGVAWGNGRDMDCETLLRCSTIALNHCKRHSRGGYQVHTAEIEQQAEYRHSLDAAIGKAIERDELSLVYQPQVDRNGKVLGAEVLLRWQHAEHGNVPPDVFIAIAEERGAIIEIGQWVLENTLRQMNEWRQACQGEPHCLQRLAINVSPHQLVSENTVQRFTEACERYGFEPEAIELEVTETGLMQNSSQIIDHLHDFAERGFKIAIDDFGTGYSSLSRLRHFPVAILKIDRSFVMNMARDASDAALVKSIIGMAHTLGFQTIAEGVEDAEQFAMLMDYGCDIFQGYFFSRPLSAEDFLAYVVATVEQSSQSGLPPQLAAIDA
ncbi:EAL domain-containing protein [Thiohalobacter sp. IOR34]|uniref:EAL domain-containing protein n=1 Tax=Thiohalobacter sp. IOR34 TaxID=3057176 RepID=UPI0025B0C0D9|nr:EAL domain-containing protein [Thiohalobacter sp. IOR34]WJW74289.1 EAL domain-containing protein [Thiohalobacter sp. IOR34]